MLGIALAVVAATTVYLVVAGVLVRRAAITHRAQKLRILGAPGPGTHGTDPPRDRCILTAHEARQHRHLVLAADEAKENVLRALFWPVALPVRMICDLPKAISGSASTAPSKAVERAWEKLGEPAQRQYSRDNERKTQLLITAQMMSSLAQSSRDNGDPEQKTSALVSAADHAWSVYDNAPGIADNHAVAELSEPHSSS